MFTKLTVEAEPLGQLPSRLTPDRAVPVRARAHGLTSAALCGVMSPLVRDREPRSGGRIIA